MFVLVQKTAPHMAYTPHASPPQVEPHVLQGPGEAWSLFSTGVPVVPGPQVSRST